MSAPRIPRWRRANGRQVLDTGVVQIGLLHERQESKALAPHEEIEQLEREIKRDGCVVIAAVIAALVLVAVVAGLGAL